MTLFVVALFACLWMGPGCFGFLLFVGLLAVGFLGALLFTLGLLFVGGLLEGVACVLALYVVTFVGCLSCLFWLLQLFEFCCIVCSGVVCLFPGCDYLLV